MHVDNHSCVSLGPASDTSTSVFPYNLQFAWHLEKCVEPESGRKWVLKMSWENVLSMGWNNTAWNHLQLAYLYFPEQTYSSNTCNLWELLFLSSAHCWFAGCFLPFCLLTLEQQPAQNRSSWMCDWALISRGQGQRFSIETRENNINEAHILCVGRIHKFIT